MIKLSFSTINTCLQPDNSHNWLNKQMGRKIPETEAMRIGKDIHKIVQARILTGDYPELKGFSVETKDFDERMRISTIIKVNKVNFEIFGFVDGRRENDLLEIKSATSFWPITKFRNSLQIGLYGFIFPFERLYGFTGLSDMGAWKMQPPRIYEVEITQRMKDSAFSWLRDAIELYQKGDFTGGLTNGKCEGFCAYGENCYFK